MRNMSLCLAAGLALVIAVTTSAAAETRYVGDSLVITVRELPDDASPKVRNIITDTPLEVLEKSADNNEFIKVRLEDGTEGYVKERYTTPDTPKPTVIERLQRDNAKLQKQYDDLAASLNEQQSSGLDKLKSLQGENGQLQKELAQLKDDNAKLKSELATLAKQHTALKANSENVEQIVNEAEKLRTDNEQLQAEFDSVKDENAMLLRTAVIKWVLTGAGILFLGWIMGKASRNKRRY